MKKVKIIKSKTKGFTLLELVVAIGISFILLSAVTVQINHSSDKFKKDIIDTSQHFYINETFRFLEAQLNDSVKKIQTDNNVLTLIKYKRQESGDKVVFYSELDFTNVDLYKIKLNGSQLELQYGSSNIPVALLLDVEDFKLCKTSNKIFISIKMIGGDYIERCFDLKYIEL
jgi:prepilin-type N-terminal cleavage/methylation domain-containing protein